MSWVLSVPLGVVWRPGVADESVTVDSASEILSPSRVDELPWAPSPPVGLVPWPGLCAVSVCEGVSSPGVVAVSEMVDPASERSPPTGVDALLAVPSAGVCVAPVDDPWADVLCCVLGDSLSPCPVIED